MEAPFDFDVRPPEGTAFADLRLGRSSDGGVVFDADAFRAVTSHLDRNLLALGPEADEVFYVIHTWYKQALSRGEPEDPAMERLRAEARGDVEPLGE